MSDGAASVEATDSQTVASLLDPSCGIPFDVHFEIEDDADNALGTLGGHKNMMALKSPVFKAMLFGPMKETGDIIKIKDTSMFAFKTTLHFIYTVEEELEWWPWSIDVFDLVRIADLAERFNLARLKAKTMDYVRRVFLFPKEKLLEIARVAEECHVYKDLSEALLTSCTHYLYAIIETPEDFNVLVRDWTEKSSDEAGIALRLLARLDHQQIAYNFGTSLCEQKVISHICNIGRHFQPRSRLQKIRNALRNSDYQERQDILTRMEMHGKNGGHLHSRHVADVLLDSLWICQKKDADEAARQGIPLKLDTPVEEQFTHEQSVKLHLELISLTNRDGGNWPKWFTDRIWKELDRAIPAVKPIILSWFRH